MAPFHGLDSRRYVFLMREQFVPALPSSCPDCANGNDLIRASLPRTFRLKIPIFYLNFRMTSWGGGSATLALLCSKTCPELFTWYHNLTQAKFFIGPSPSSPITSNFTTSKIFKMAPIGTLYTVSYQAGAKYVRYLTLSPWILELILFFPLCID